MNSVFAAFILSLLLAAGLIRLNQLYPGRMDDYDLQSVQKFHKIPVPRVGGLAIFLGVLGACTFRLLDDEISGITGIKLIICTLPVFMFGLLEDITKNVSPMSRFIAAILSGVLFICWMNASIYRTDITIIDSQLQFPVFSILFTCVILAGLTNAYNIIDGFNGLTSMIAVITISAIGYVSFRNQDIVLSLLSLVSIAAILGFFLLNYPRGMIFLGDGGAYFLGFWVGGLSILVSIRNPGVSPWFAVLINIYPTFETIFSIWRKRFIKKMSPSVPDGVHLHMLIYGRLSRWLYADTNRHFIQNSRTSPFLWVLSSAATIPACIWWKDTLILQIFSLLFCATYYWIYRRIIHFKIQKFYSRKNI